MFSSTKANDVAPTPDATIRVRCKKTANRFGLANIRKKQKNMKNNFFGIPTTLNATTVYFTTIVSKLKTATYWSTSFYSG